MNTPSQAPDLAVSRREVLVRAIANARSVLCDAQQAVSATTTDRDLTSSAVLHLPTITESFEQVQGLLSVLADGDSDETDGVDILEQLANKKRKLSVVSPETARAVVGGKQLRHLHRLQLSNAVHISPLDALGIDLLIIILSFLEWDSVMEARVCRRLKEASILTPVGKVLVPKGLGQCLDGDLNKLGMVLPGIEKIELFDPDTEVRNGKCRFWEGPTCLQCFDVDLGNLRSFQNLKELDLYGTNLNGSYPAIFKIVSLEKLELGGNPWLRCDLSDIIGLPNLTLLLFSRCKKITGSLSSLGHLRDSLELLDLFGCDRVVGSLMELASFKNLRFLDLAFSGKISGDIREIESFHFPSLKDLRIGYTKVFGGIVPRVAEGRIVAMAWRRLLLQRGAEFSCCGTRGIPAGPSENYFVGDHYICHEMKLIRRGEHAFGFQWVEYAGDDDDVPGGLQTCEINWVDYPSFPSEELRFFVANTASERVRSAFHGMLVPPTDEGGRTSLIERYLAILRIANETASYYERAHRTVSV